MLAPKEASRSPAPKPAAKPPQAAHGICTSAESPRLAAQISAGIKSALAGRASVVGIEVDDPALGITCQLHPWWRDDAASVAKVMILAGLLHELTAEGRQLSPAQAGLATQMITESDNDAHDEMLLLRLLVTRNTVLDQAAQNYQLGLMARVLPAGTLSSRAG
ncbi:MAG: hypothetical protein ACRDNF_15055 [Streptosporangiaceae bacterium]